MLVQLHFSVSKDNKLKRITYRCQTSPDLDNKLLNLGSIQLFCIKIILQQPVKFFVVTVRYLIAGGTIGMMVALLNSIILHDVFFGFRLVNSLVIRFHHLVTEVLDAMIVDTLLKEVKHPRMEQEQA